MEIKRYPDPDNPNCYWTIEEGQVGPGTLALIPNLAGRIAGEEPTIIEDFTTDGTFAVKRDINGKEITRILMY